LQNHDSKYKLVEAIRLAQFAPGQTYSCAKIAAFLRISLIDLMELLQELSPKGLYSILNTDIIIAPIDRAALLHQLPMICALEEKIVRAAAKNITEEDKLALREALGLLRRSTLIGDVTGNINADFLLEQMIGKASNLPTDVTKLTELNQEFKRAWCAFNRLKDMTHASKQRESLVDCVMGRNADGAALAVREFFENAKNCI
jgi:DNA-binding GntR family transcriptional regulator